MHPRNTPSFNSPEAHHPIYPVQGVTAERGDEPVEQDAA
jgi:hypothetical protein